MGLFEMLVIVFIIVFMVVFGFLVDMCMILLLGGCVFVVGMFLFGLFVGISFVFFYFFGIC